MLKASQDYTKHDNSTVWKQRQSYKGQYSEIHYVTSRNKKYHLVKIYEKSFQPYGKIESTILRKLLKF